MPPEDTPQELMQRIATLHASHNDLKNDMLEEVAKIETLLIAPIADCRVRDERSGVYWEERKLMGKLGCG
jgi:hypothetical protein